MPYNLDTIGARLKHEIADGRRYVIAVVAEGTKMAEYLTRYINDSIGMEARLTVLGHVQRGGSPTVLDRVMAFKFAVAAVDSLEAGQTNSIMVSGRHLRPRSHRGGCAQEIRMDPALLKLAAPLAC